MNPRCPRRQRTTSTWTPISRPTSSTSPMYSPSTQTVLNVGTCCFTWSSNSAPTSRSAASAAVPHTSNGNPNLSTTRWCLCSSIFFFPTVPTPLASGLGALHCLTVHDTRRGLRGSPFTSMDFASQQSYGFGQHAPLTSRVHHVKDGIHHLSCVYPTGTPWLPLWLQHQRRYQRPLGVGQVCRILSSCWHHSSFRGHARGF